MSRVWESSRSRGSELLLLLAIADHANEDGYAYPGIASLARKARMSKRNTRYVLGKLVKAGELIISRGTARRGTNEYRVQIAKTADGGARIASPAKEGAGGCNPAYERGAIAVAPEPSLNRQSEAPRAREEIESRHVQRADQLAAEASKHGVHFSAHHAKVIAWAGAGVTIEEMRQALQRARKRKPEGNIPPGYLDPIVAEIAKPGAATSLVRPKVWWESASGITATGEELGIVQRIGEPFPNFKARVLKAAGDGPWRVAA
jgi:hypothetical protein